MSVSEKITSIENHISEAYTSLANMGADLTNIDKNIENISSKIDEIYNNAPKTSYVEGSNISISNSLKGKVSYEDNKVVKGNTSQNTLTGKNLIDFSTIQYTVANSATVTRSGNEITITTDSTAMYGNCYFTQADLNLKPNTSYVFRAKIKSTNTTSGSRVRVNGSMSATGTEVISSATTQGNVASLTFTTPSSISSSGAVIGLYPYEAGKTTTFSELMVCEGTTTTTSYEPYCGGIPSPNPRISSKYKCSNRYTRSNSRRKKFN